MHVVEEVAPLEDEYVAFGQFEQDMEPVASLYVPPSHAMQTPPSAPVYPLLHVQSVFATLPSGDQVNVGQASTHAPDPAATLYIPSGQRVQGPLSGPVDPAPQSLLQAPSATDPGGDVFPVGQETQVAEPRVFL